jgi:hypothetical protein
MQSPTAEAILDALRAARDVIEPAD